MATTKKMAKKTGAPAKAKGKAKKNDPDAAADAAGAGSDELSLAEIAAIRDTPVVTVSRLIEQFPAKEEPPKTDKPNFALQMEVIFAPLPTEPAERPDRVATELRTHVMGNPNLKPQKKKAPSIGSMSPSRRA